MNETSKRAEQAVELKHTTDVHTNCAQAVLLAYQDKLGKTTEELRALGSAFGGGMGGMEATCGALTGAAVVLGPPWTKSGREPKQVMNEILQGFKEKAGATLCKDLKGVENRQDALLLRRLRTPGRPGPGKTPGLRRFGG